MLVAKPALLSGALVVIAIAVCATPSRAAIEAAVEDTPGAVGSQTLTLKSDGPGTNIVFVRYAPPAYLVTSAMLPLSVGAGCMRTDLQTATCMGAIGLAMIRGGDGSDVIDLTGVPVPVDGDGGAGDDALDGGAVSNTLVGGDGVDQLTGGPQGDDLAGGAGDDLLLGKGSGDALAGGSGDDILEAGSGDRDVLLGGPGRDLVRGGSGYDVLQGGAGADVLLGGAGPDTIAPGAGADRVMRFGAADRLDCPTRVSGGELVLDSCAKLATGAPPEAWPPHTASQSRRRGKASAAPVIAGAALSVKVHVPDTVSRRVHRCIRTYGVRHVALRPYVAGFKSKFWPKVRSPAPNPVARSAKLTRVKHCRR